MDFFGTPRQLLQTLLSVERAFGRERRQRWGPRTLDLDVLWIARSAIRECDLVVPHPHLFERPFAWQPLLDVAPDALDPRTSQPFVFAGASAPLRPMACSLVLGG